MERISIVVPTRDRREWLPGCIDSILAQTHTDWELIVVDNGDDTVGDLIPDDPRCSYVWTEPVGMSAVVNHGLALCTSPLVTALSDDDRLTAHAFETYQAALGDKQWVVAGTLMRSPSGVALYYRGGTFENVAKTQHGEYMLGGAICWRREFAEKHGYFDQAFDGATDFELFTRWIDAEFPAFTAELVALHTVHPEQDSQANLGRQMRVTQRLEAERRRKMASQRVMRIPDEYLA